MAELQGKIDELTAEQVGLREEILRIANALRELRKGAQRVPDVEVPAMGSLGVPLVPGLSGAIVLLLDAWNQHQETRSVRQAVQELMEAEDCTWTSSDVLAMLTQLPAVTNVRNLPAAVRTALWQLRRDGTIITLSDGRSVATKWPGYIASRLPDDDEDTIHRHLPAWIASSVLDGNATPGGKALLPG